MGREASAAIRASGATGDLRLHEFRSRVFRNTRFLRVWLPPGYDDAENAGRRYPVFYLNDGQNLFEAATAFAGIEWQVDETADRLIREGVVPPMIIVGIDNTGKDRIREYMPHRSMNPMMLRVQGRHYPDFLMKEVMPFVERNYRVATGPENTGLGGSSLGALIALYTAMARPGVIGRLLLESPSLWASGRQAYQGKPVGENLAGANLSGGGNCRGWKRGAEPDRGGRCAGTGGHPAASGAEREAVAAGDRGWSRAQRGGVGGAISGGVGVLVRSVIGQNALSGPKPDFELESVIPCL